MSYRITSIQAIEILDSRGYPTLRVTVTLDDGTRASASVPSGASTGKNEAAELRDGDPARYGGRGVLKAVANVNELLAPRLGGQSVMDQQQIDSLMIELDGSPNKQRLGANAILGVSLAVARAAAAAAGIPLYRHLGGPGAHILPVPMMNVVNGGKHADSGLDFQEFMIVPIGAPTFSEALRYGAETFHALKALLHELGQSTAVGDEGGFAPRLEKNAAACDLILAAIEKAGYQAGVDVAIALDPAASSFGDSTGYRIEGSTRPWSSEEMVGLYESWCRKYPIISIEDGLGEDDWQGFKLMNQRLGEDLQIVGDDLLVTNPRLIDRAITEGSCNAVLIKPNQIGTVSETLEAVDHCRGAGLNYVVSHRSGETEDSFIGDLAVALGGGQIKTGSLCRSERIAKYNRLLEIERELGPLASFPNGLG